MTTPDVKPSGLQSEKPGPAKKKRGRFKRTLDKVIHIETTILLTIFYFTVFGLTAILLKVFRKELLPGRDPKRTSYWRPHHESDVTLDSMKRQF